MIEPPAGENMRSRVLGGLAWKAASQVVFQLSRVVVAVILARLLAPRDYGLAGMVLVFSSFVLVFSDLALGAALVQRRTLTEQDRSTVFWTGIGAGLVFTLAGIALSGPVAAFYGEPEVQPLLAALSLSFLVTSLGTTQIALLTREMSFRSLELRQIGATLAGAIVGIATALEGFGAWAIIWQQLAITAVSTALVWRVSPWRPRLTFSLESLRRLGGFSSNVFGQRTLYYATRNVDKLLVGRFLGPAALGVYALAYNVILMPFNQLAGPIQQVLFPAFSRMQDDRERIAAVWIRATRLVGIVSIPSLLALIVIAPDFVQVVLGERWSEATTIVQILCWVGLLQSLQTLNGDILQALDRTGTLLRFFVLWSVVNLGAVIIGLPWGIIGVATCLAVAATFLEPLNAYLTARTLGISIGAYVRSLLPLFQASFVMLVAVLAARTFFVSQGVGAGARLGLLTLIGAAVFVPCCAWRAPELVAEIRALVQRPRSAPSVRAEPQPTDQ